MLFLRPFKECDGPKIVSWIKSEKSFYQWSAGRLGTYPPKETLLNEFHKENENDESNFQMTACNNNGPVGFVNFRYLNGTTTDLRLGFIIVDDAQRGKGYGKKMLRAALEYAFRVLRVQRVSLGVFDNNEPAKQCYIRAGFRRMAVAEPVIKSFMGESWLCHEMECYGIPEQDAAEQENTSDSSAIADIVDNNRFRYAFQPIVSAKSGEIYGYEALMRAEADGPVSPVTILKWATENNRLYDIEKATFFNVMQHVANRQDMFENRFIFANSIPGNSLKDADYEELRSRYGQFFSRLMVEITEETELEDKELYMLLRRSKESGFGLALDDYGTGYSNTSNLLRYLPNVVKIDRLLVSNIHQDVKKQHFVRSIVEYAQENGFMTLAEGVETSAELKQVINLGVDYIQGYYTGMPSFEICSEIDPEIRNEIINTNVRGQTQSNRKVYVVGEDEEELPLMRIALLQNTGMVIGAQKFMLVGNPDYMAAMNIKIKDGSDTELTLKNVLLESFQEMPCIELGENVHLKLVLEGKNYLRKVGICVPATSSLTIVGSGDMTINVKGILSYGIGNTREAQVGDIQIDSGGSIEIGVEADDAIAIGGGQFMGERGIHVHHGNLKIELASAKAIGIGCVKGTPEISLDRVNMTMDLRIGDGIGVGCMEDKATISIANSKLIVTGAGSRLAGIGSMDKDVDIQLSHTKLHMVFTGQTMYLMGTGNGRADIDMKKSEVVLRGEGSEVLGMGSRIGQGYISGTDTDCDIAIRSCGFMVYGASEENIHYEGGVQKTIANE